MTASRFSVEKMAVGNNDQKSCLEANKLCEHRNRSIVLEREKGAVDFLHESVCSRDWSNVLQNRR